MKILIVDDDVPTVQAICDLMEWKTLGISEVVKAYDFAEAKQQVQKHCPQIILCDIEMPKGSGLELLRWLREEKITAEFIFLTCHESFEYAQTALRYEAADYITKPFDVQNTQSVLAKVANKVRYQQKVEKESQAAVRWQDGHKLAQQTFLRNFALGQTQMEPKELDERLEELEMPLRSTENCVLVLTALSQSKMPDGWNMDLFQYALRNLAVDLLADMDETLVVTYGHSETRYNLAVLNELKTPEQAAQQCQKLRDFAAEYVGAAPTCYYSQIVPFHSLPQIRTQMEEFDRANVAHRGEVLAGWGGPAPMPKQQIGLDVEQMEQLFLQERVSEIVTAVQTLLCRLSEQNRLSPDAMQSIQQDLLQVMYTVLRKNEIEAHHLLADHLSQQLRKNAASSVFDMVKWVSFTADQIVREIQVRKKTQSVSGQMKQFIHEHYMESIGRDEVASYVYLTPDYANRIFKNEWDISIKEYLNQYRIKQAKKKLLEGVNVSEVADQTGFANFSYFSTVFKKYAGCSPSEYRKTCDSSDLQK